MPVLSIARQEKFARSVASGSNHAAAARTAGYSPRYAACLGYQLVKQPRVAERIRELRQLGQNAQAITVVDGAGRPLFYIAFASGFGAVGFNSPNQIELLGK